MSDYYADPVDDWMLCMRCKKRPATYFVGARADAGLLVYCDSCMPARRRPWAQPYTPWRNQEIERSASGLRRALASG